MTLRRRAHLGQIAGVAALLALAACSSTAESTPPASPTPTTTSASNAPGADESEWTLGLDSRPTRAVTDGRLVFVTTSGGGKFPPQLYAVDAASGALLAHRSASGLPYGLAVAADGALWVAGTRHSDQPTGGGVNVYDGDTLLSVGLADVPGEALTVARVGAEIWVGSQGVVFVLDPVDQSLVRTMPIEGSVTQLVPRAGDEGVVAVVTTAAGASAIVVMDADGAALQRADVDADGSVVAAATSAVLWVRAPEGTDSVLLRYDLPGLGRTDTGVRTDSAGGGLVTTTAGGVLLVDERGDTVTCVPSGDGTPAEVPAGDLSGVLADLGDGRALFATASGIAVRVISCEP